ncbi:uncharacterized protein [Panulirus ornatus]|uniref:uncharacterized protein n=1 Tax=Panulirus ornatus TaxID=150431 RepID=UPI003A8C7A83
MMHVLLLLVAVVGRASCSALPDAPVLEVGGFHPVQGARGTGPASGYSAPPHPTTPAHATHAAPIDGPTKTIYVNVPHPTPASPLPPIAAGPPRKHYKIVFIRAPPPPPPPQPILPPRTERKTLIYVLHRRPQVQEQKVIRVPNVQHDPEVYFVQYDNPPSAEELQQLSAGNLQGYSVAAQRTGAGDATGAVNRSPALSGPLSDEVSLELVADVDGVGTGFPPTGLVDSGSVEIPLTGSGGGIPLPTLPSTRATPTPAGEVGIPLPTLRGAGSSTRAPLPPTGSGVGIPLPGLGAIGGSGSSASVFPTSLRGGTGGSGLRVIGDDLVRPIGNTGLFQEVDDDYDVFGNSFEAPGLSIENLSFENRVGAAGTTIPSLQQPART